MASEWIVLEHPRLGSIKGELTTDHPDCENGLPVLVIDGQPGSYCPGDWIPFNGTWVDAWDCVIDQSGGRPKLGEPLRPGALGGARPLEEQWIRMLRTISSFMGGR
jgi:hypothetical protein